MTVRVSTKVRNGLLNNLGIGEIFLDGHLILYGGTGVPTRPETAINTGTNPILLTIDLNDAGGIGFNTAAIAGGVLQKKGTWSATSVAGTPIFYRLVADGEGSNDGTTADPDDNTYSRIQGEIGPTKDMVLSNTVFSGGTETIDYFNLTIPESIFG